MSDWSDEELKDSVVAYLQLLEKEQSGERINKAAVYRALAEKHDRTAKAFEYRFQNISYIFDLLGRRWVTGLKPKSNVGPTNAEKIERILAEIERRPVNGYITFEAQVDKLLERQMLKEPEGSYTPKRTLASSTRIERDPAVKAWVLQKASGTCECCSQKAPFSKTNGQPYLEVHHLQPLAEGGRDTTDNAVALCPNCHRELHYGMERDSLKQDLISRIKRLKG